MLVVDPTTPYSFKSLSQVSKGIVALPVKKLKLSPCLEIWKWTELFGVPFEKKASYASGVPFCAKTINNENSVAVHWLEPSSCRRASLSDLLNSKALFPEKKFSFKVGSPEPLNEIQSAPFPDLSFQTLTSEPVSYTHLTLPTKA